jgi:ATP-dependent DNA helicase RecG
VISSQCKKRPHQSLRAHFHLPEGKGAIVSQVVAMTIEAGLIKADEKVGSSRKYARYLLFWA